MFPIRKKFELDTESLNNVYAQYHCIGAKVNCSIQHLYGTEELNTELGIYIENYLDFLKDKLLKEFCHEIGLSLEKVVYRWSPNCYWSYYKCQYDWDRHAIIIAPVIEEERFKRLDERFTDISVDDLEKIYLRRVRCI